MVRSALKHAAVDPTPIFELFRGAYATELLTAAVVHLGVFHALAEKPLAEEELRRRIGLAPRASTVLVTALRAMGLISRMADGRLDLPALAREHLVAGAAFDVSGYLGLAGDSPGVREMVERLRSNRPAGAAEPGAGAAFIYREGIESAMEQEAAARRLTLALAGRAKNVAPLLADQADLTGVRRLLDVGGGTGIYSVALMQKHAGLRAAVFDRPEVLRVAEEFAQHYGVRERIELAAGDMFADPWPADCEAVLLSNVLHDWDAPECRFLVKRAADCLPSGGRVLIHDVFLDDELDGPLPVALYSASLFSLTEGRAYSGAEFRGWLREAGLVPGEIRPTLIHCGVLEGRKP